MSENFVIIYSALKQKMCRFGALSQLQLLLKVYLQKWHLLYYVFLNGILHFFLQHVMQNLNIDNFQVHNITIFNSDKNRNSRSIQYQEVLRIIHLDQGITFMLILFLYISYMPPLTIWKIISTDSDYTGSRKWFEINLYKNYSTWSQ